MLYKFIRDLSHAYALLISVLIYLQFKSVLDRNFSACIVLSDIHVICLMMLMQPCRTLPRPITPTTLLDSICWVVTDTPSAAEVYTDSSGKASFENDEAKNGYEDDNGQYRDPGNKVSDKEFYTRLLSER